jgi:hypothetical protein
MTGSDQEPVRPTMPAVVGVALAGALASILGRGDWTWASVALGITLLLVLHAFDDPTDTDPAVHLAFSAVWSLVALVALGLPLQWVDRHDWIGGENLAGYAFVIWLLLTATWTLWGVGLRASVRRGLQWRLKPRRGPAGAQRRSTTE